MELFHLQKFSATKIVRFRDYEYFENGPLKKVITKNENEKVIDVIEYKIEYNE